MTFGTLLASGNSRHLATPPLVSPPNDVCSQWETSAEIPYCFWFVESNFPRGATNQKQDPDLGNDASSVWNFCPRFSHRHLAEKPVVASPNVGCFLRLELYRRLLSTYQETSWTLKNMSFISYWESTSVAGFTLPLGRLSSELPKSFPFSLCCRLYWNGCLRCRDLQLTDIMTKVRTIINSILPYDQNLE